MICLPVRGDIDLRLVCDFDVQALQAYFADQRSRQRMGGRISPCSCTRWCLRARGRFRGIARRGGYSRGLVQAGSIGGATVVRSVVPTA
jgi:hypothetical protein